MKVFSDSSLRLVAAAEVRVEWQSLGVFVVGVW